jgi:hypothetical protein
MIIHNFKKSVALRATQYRGFLALVFAADLLTTGFQYKKTKFKR